MRLNSLVITVIVGAVGVSAQSPLGTLTDDSIRAAIAIGQKSPKSDFALRIIDSGQMFAAAMGGASSASNTGFSLELFTPATWIKSAAANAAKEYRPFTLADVTPEMRDLVLRVIVHPDGPTQVSAKGLRNTSSVQHVVVRTLDRKHVVQPTDKQATDAQVSNAMGGKAQFYGVVATFSLAALAQESIYPGSNGFLVTVIGDGRKERDFEIKQKHFERLR